MKAGACSTLMVAALLGGCGGSSSKQANGTCTPGDTTEVGIAATGVSPKAVCVLPGGTVTFTNHDTVSHPIQATTAGTSCAPLDLPPIPAGQPATTPPLPTVATCAFSDGSSDAAFQGTVYVTTAPSGGPGY